MAPPFLRIFINLFTVCLLTCALSAQNAEGPTTRDTQDDRTLSPYFWVKNTLPGDDSSRADQADPLPLKATKVQATIAGVFAEVKVTQRYANTGSIPLEAVYIFPGSTRASVHGLTLQVGDRRIEAKTKERGEARKVYEQAKTEGKTASLLEQQRPNVFQMNVANILPGDDVEVELRYTELLVPESGVYEFVYPGVVGPRYSNRAVAGAPAEQAWVANPYLRKGDADPASYELKVDLVAGMALQDLACRTHETRIDYRDANSAQIELTSEGGSNRDFVLNYRLAGAQIQSGLIVAKGETENFFLLMMQPPKRPDPKLVPPREYVFIVDVSGSMNGFPLDTAKTLMRDLLGGLRPEDTFNVLLFSGDNAVLSPQAIAANRVNIESATRLLDQQSGGGGTELLPALQTALAMPADEARSRTFVVVTDGYVTVETEAFALVRENLGRANLFAFGIGPSVNRALIEGLARAGLGEPFVVTEPDQAAEEASRFRRYVSTPVLTRVKVEFPGFETYDVEPSYQPDLLAERPLIVFGKWRGAPQGSAVVTGTNGNGAYRSVHDVAAAQKLPSADGLARLWARTKIALLGDLASVDPKEEYKAQITTLGLTYNLLTRYTSFVAVDNVVRRTGATQQTVKQPLPLPANVEETAVGGGVGAAPEPSTYGLMAIGLLVIAVALRRFRADR